MFDRELVLNTLEQVKKLGDTIIERTKSMEMTQPDSPNSPTQRYRLTEIGKGLLK